jgi:hypothetical protein
VIPAPLQVMANLARAGRQADRDACLADHVTKLIQVGALVDGCLKSTFRPVT